MFLGIKDFDFCQNLIKFYPNFIQILRFTQIIKFFQILLKFSQILSKFAQIVSKFS